MGTFPPCRSTPSQPLNISLASLCTVSSSFAFTSLAVQDRKSMALTRSQKTSWIWTMQKQSYSLSLCAEHGKQTQQFWLAESQWAGFSSAILSAMVARFQPSFKGEWRLWEKQLDKPPREHTDMIWNCKFYWKIQGLIIIKWHLLSTENMLTVEGTRTHIFSGVAIMVENGLVSLIANHCKWETRVFSLELK